MSYAVSVSKAPGFAGRLGEMEERRITRESHIFALSIWQHSYHVLRWDRVKGPFCFVGFEVPEETAWCQSGGALAVAPLRWEFWFGGSKTAPFSSRVKDAGLTWVDEGAS